MSARLELVTEAFLEREALNGACAHVAKFYGKIAACLLRHIATAIGGLWRGQRGLVDAVSRMLKRSVSLRAVQYHLDTLIRMGLVVLAARDRQKSYRAEIAPFWVEAGHASRHAKPTCSHDLSSLLDPSLHPPALAALSNGAPHQVEITRTKSNHHAQNDNEDPMTKPIEQRPMFPEAEDRVWETFLEERARRLRRDLKPEQAERRIARLPKLTPLRRKALQCFVDRNGEEDSKLVVVGFWCRDSRHEGAVVDQCIDKLLQANEGWIEQLTNIGDDAMAEREERAERERVRLAMIAEQNAAEAAKYAGPEGRARRAAEVAQMDAVHAEFERMKAEDNVVPMRRSGAR